MFNALKRGWIWLTASRKRFSFALTLALVGLLLWSRLIILSNLPRTAVADDEVSTAPDARQTTAGGESSDKQPQTATQENPEKRPNDAPRASSEDETGSVSNSFQDEVMFREEGK